MGQRLNIEIIDSNYKILANCYYHNKGFTRKALELSKQILDKLEYIHRNPEKFKKFTNKEIAVYLLYKDILGPGIENKMIRDANTSLIYASENFKSLPVKKVINRDEGMICLTKDSIEDTRYWEEARLSINIGLMKMNVSRLFKELDDEEREEYANKVFKITRFKNKLTRLPFDKDTINKFLKLSDYSNLIVTGSGKNKKYLMPID